MSWLFDRVDCLVKKITTLIRQMIAEACLLCLLALSSSEHVWACVSVLTFEIVGSISLFFERYQPG